MGRAVVTVATVVLEGAVTLGADAELRRSDWEGVEDATGVEEEEGTEELATGELVEELEGLAVVVVLVALLLKLRVERKWIRRR